MMVCLFALAATLKKPKKANQTDTMLTPVPSFNELYNKHFAFVWRSVRSLGVPEASVDDAVQEVFVVVHRRLDSYRPESSMKSWLFGIARRVAKDFRRTQKRKGNHVTIRDQDIATDKTNPHTEAETNQALRIIEEFAGSLDEERRAIFVLSELEQISTARVSKMLNLNVNTVYSRIKVIRENLAKKVAEQHSVPNGGRHE